MKQYFLRELQEQGLIEVEWVNENDQTSDLFTKNLPRPTFEKHGSKFFGIDEYMMDDNVEAKSDGQIWWNPREGSLLFSRGSV